MGEKTCRRDDEEGGLCLALIDIKNLYYKYPTSDTWILNNINLKIGKERVVITGGTGSGKTTLLRVIAGLATKIYGGELIGEVKVVGKAVYVPQDFDLYVLMPTLRDELTYILASQGVIPSEVEIRKLSKLLGVEDVLDRNIMKLSMGQRQRAAIVSALALKPDILLLDEPFAHIDPKGVIELLKTLNDIDITIVLAEHKLRYLTNWVDRVILLRSGSVSYDGPLKNLSTLDLDVEWPLELSMKG